QAQAAFWTVRENDGSALGIENGHGIIEDAVQQLLFRLDVTKVVAGAKQGEQLVAGPGAVVAVKRQVVERLLERGPGSRLDPERVGAGWVLFLALDKCLDNETDLADLQHVAGTQGPLAGAKANAVEAGPVGAAQVLDPPAAFAGAHLGVQSADR